MNKLTQLILSSLFILILVFQHNVHAEDFDLAKKIVSISQKGEKKEFTEGTDKTITYTVTLSCPADKPAECSASTCASTEAACSDECAVEPNEPGRCANGGQCVDGINAFTCQCAAGWTGVDCSINVNECLSNPCANGGQCVDGINAFTCACAVGYEGEFCDIATPLLQGSINAADQIQAGDSMTVSAEGWESITGSGLTYEWTSSSFECASALSKIEGEAIKFKAPIDVATCELKLTVTDKGNKLRADFTKTVEIVQPTILTGSIKAEFDQIQAGKSLKIAAVGWKSITDSVLSYAWTSSSSGCVLSESKDNQKVITLATAEDVDTCKVTVTVTDKGNNATGSATKTVQIVHPPRGGSVSVEPTQVESGEEVTVSTRGWVDSEGSGKDLLYSWSASCEGGLGDHAIGPKVKSRNLIWNVPFNNTGKGQNCTITVEVIDAKGATATATTNVTVNFVATTTGSSMQIKKLSDPLQSKQKTTIKQTTTTGSSMQITKPSDLLQSKPTTNKGLVSCPEATPIECAGKCVATIDECLQMQNNFNSVQ